MIKSEGNSNRNVCGRRIIGNRNAIQATLTSAHMCHNLGEFILHEHGQKLLLCCGIGKKIFILYIPRNERKIGYQIIYMDTIYNAILFIELSFIQ